MFARLNVCSSNLASARRFLAWMKSKNWPNRLGQRGDPPLAFQNQTPPPGRVSGRKYPPGGGGGSPASVAEALLSKLAVTARFSAASGGLLEAT